jgi:hypothetical protein
MPVTSEVAADRDDQIIDDHGVDLAGLTVGAAGASTGTYSSSSAAGGREREQAERDRARRAAR